MLLLVTVFCLWLGWQAKWIHDRHEALMWVKTINSRPAVVTGTHNVLYVPGTVPAPWRIRLFGEAGVRVIRIDRLKIEQQDHLDSKLEELRKLFPESSIEID